MKEVLLIQPPIPTPNKQYTKSSTLSTPPIALGYLASILIGEGYTVDILDMEILDIKASKLRKILVENSPKLVGISTTTLTYKNALRVAEIVKDINFKTKTILGGSHATFRAEDALLNPYVDYVIRGEGELSFLELARFVLEKYGDLCNIKGISTRKSDGNFFHNPRCPYIQDLNIIPFPAWYLLPLHLYSAPGLIITGRGCEGRCIFCAARGIAGGRYRLRSIDNVLSEIETMVSSLGLRFFFFADDTFTTFPERTQAFCRALQQRDLHINWMCETRADSVNRTTLQTMVDAGCKLVQFGAESGSQKILDLINKNISVSQLRNAVQTALNVGLSPSCSFMFPHPTDTVETVRETKNFMLELQSMGVKNAVSLTTPFPGTYLSTHLADLGLTLICDDTDQYDFATPVIETKFFNVWDIRNIYFEMMLICLEGNIGLS